MPMNRTLLSLAVASAALLSHATSVCAAPIPADCRTGGLHAIGCQAYTFTRFTLFEAIEKTAATGSKVIELPVGQKLSAEDPNVNFDHNVSDAVLEKVQAKLAEYHLRPVNYGVISISKDETEARKVFDFARKLGLYAVITSPWTPWTRSKSS